MVRTGVHIRISGATNFSTIKTVPVESTPKMFRAAERVLGHVEGWLLYRESVRFVWVAGAPIEWTIGPWWKPTPEYPVLVGVVWKGVQSYGIGATPEEAVAYLLLGALNIPYEAAD